MSEQLVNIEGTDLSIREYNGHRVVTLKDIDRVHGKKDDTAKKAFRRYKKHFILNEDYFEMTRKELGERYSPNTKIIGNPNIVTYLFTESGYLMIAKIFTDDKAWNVQRQLVNSYFALKSQSVNKPDIIPEHLRLERNTDWFAINILRINKICWHYEITTREYMHHVLTVINKYYDFNAAKKKYLEQTGKSKCTNSEVITYFPQISEIANKVVEMDIENVRAEEATSN